MCGRYASTKSPAVLATEFDAVDATGDTTREADYNVAPTKDVYSVVERHPRGAEGQRDESRTERSVRVMRWGLVPKWAKDPGSGARMINARAETVTSRPAFRTAIRYYRCLLPADGWFEWQQDAAIKQPYFMTSPDDTSIALAGLWATWRDRESTAASPLVSCSVLTTRAVGPLAEVHERMPLVLGRSAWARWLNPEEHDVGDLLVPPAREFVDALEIRPVSTKVNRVDNNGADLLTRAPDAAAGESEHPVLLDRDDAQPG